MSLLTNSFRGFLVLCVSIDVSFTLVQFPLKVLPPHHSAGQPHDAVKQKSVGRSG